VCRPQGEDKREAPTTLGIAYRIGGTILTVPEILEGMLFSKFEEKEKKKKKKGCSPLFQDLLLTPQWPSC